MKYVIRVVTKLKIREVKEQSGNCKIFWKIKKILGFKEVQYTYITSTLEYYQLDNQMQAVSATLLVIYLAMLNGSLDKIFNGFQIMMKIQEIFKYY